MLQELNTPKGPQNPIPVEIQRQLDYILEKITDFETRIEALEALAGE